MNPKSLLEWSSSLFSLKSWVSTGASYLLPTYFRLLTPTNALHQPHHCLDHEHQSIIGPSSVLNTRCPVAVLLLHFSQNNDLLRELRRGLFAGMSHGRVHFH